jgi:uncharacterized protein YaiI (UPF0178 family)
LGQGGGTRLTVWVDSDSCPAVVREIIARETEKEDSVKVVFSSNRQIPCPEGNHIRFNLSANEKDSTDLYILINAKPGDMILTKDFLLAKKALELNILAMNFDGRVFDEKWLLKRIEERNMMEILYKSGSINQYRKKSRDSSQNKQFTFSFSKELYKILLNKGVSQ